MCCEEIERQLGRYLDQELSAAEREKVEAHLEYCSGCRGELEELRELVEGIGGPAPVKVPESLWASIERRLDQPNEAVSSGETKPRFRLRSTPWALAAAVVLAVGLGVIGIASFDTSARASTVDFTALLEALPLDARKAFTEFLVRYDAKLTTAESASRTARHLNFATPEELPGGFRLRSVYELRMGRDIGIAASYDRAGEFLAAVFHPPMKHEKYGSHEDYPCVIGDKCGHKVQVGEWKLVHLTDPTTCHCLLSRLDEQSEMPAVMNAIAPDLPDSRSAQEQRHP